VALEDVNRTVIAERMPRIAANEAFAKGVPSLVVAHLGGIRTEKPKIPRINPIVDSNL